MEIQTDFVISNKDLEIFMINHFLFLKNKLVTSNGSFKNANHGDSGTVDQEDDLFCRQSSFRDSAEGQNKKTEISMQEQHQHSGPCVVSPPWR